ncbi:MAG: hypothetical protein P8R42_03400 [Candidatus Binatia bacterium]|nr:hypothetical protein [Candidatus Binatia bacterium]
MNPKAESGLVLLSLVLLLALLGLVTGASLWFTRAELWAAGRARSELQAAYTAEAGVRHGLALLAPDVDLTALAERSVDALAAPDTPGPWPIAGGGWVAFPGPPFGYGLEVAAAGDTRRVVVRSSATAVRDAALVAVASVALAAEPYAPATLVLGGGPLSFEAAALGGSENRLVTIVGSHANRVAAIGTASSVELEAAIESAEVAGAGIEGDGMATVRRFPLSRFALRSGLDEWAPDVLNASVGARGNPVALRIRGGVVPRLLGAGLLYVAGDLDVMGEVDFAGVVFVEGQVRIGGESCRLDGMLWAREVAFSGACRVAFDAAAVADADRALRLPRLPVLTGLAGG